MMKLDKNNKRISYTIRLSPNEIKGLDKVSKKAKLQPAVFARMAVVYSIDLALMSKDFED